VRELRHYLHHLDIDAARLYEFQQQMSLLQDLARKHRVRFVELPAHFEDLSQQLNELENYEENANRLEAELSDSLQAYRVAAEELHQQRLKTAQQLSEKMTAEMI